MLNLAAASDIGIELYSVQIPLDALRSLDDAEQALRWALAGGDDYELLFCLPPAAALPAGCTEIGRVVVGSGISCDVMPEQFGYDHLPTDPRRADRQSGNPRRQRFRLGLHPSRRAPRVAAAALILALTLQARSRFIGHCG